MKKISLKNLRVLGIKELSRENLKNVTGGMQCPNQSDFMCASGGTCIPAEYRCDGVPHCPDRSDEVGCDEILRKKKLILKTTSVI